MSHVTCHIVTLSHCHLSHCQLSLVKLSIVTSQNGYCQKNPGLEGKLPIIVDFITFESIIDIFRVDYQHDRHGDNRSRAESRKSTVSIIEVESIRSPLHERSTEWRAMWISIAMQFVVGIQISVYYMSMWPYLSGLDKTADMDFLGWVVAACNIGCTISNPLYGLWNQKTLSCKWPTITGFLIAAIGQVMYGAISEVQDNGKWYMLAARVVTGLGVGNLAALRAYGATASVPKDRLKAISYGTAGYVFGISFGPAISAFFTPLGESGFTIWIVNINMYTSAAYLMALICVAASVLMLLFFQEDYAGIVDKKNEDGKAGSYVVVPKYDLVPALVCIYLYMIVSMIATNIEVMSTPLTTVLYDWKDSQAILYNGIIESVTCIVSVLINFGIGKSRIGKIDKRIQILFGLFVFVAFHLVNYPWWFYSGPLHFLPPGSNTTLVGGCLDSYTWCSSTTRVPMFLYIFAFVVFFGIAFPFVESPAAALYSEILGPRKQGVMQGLFSFGGSITPFVASIVMTFLFQHTGYKYVILLQSATILIAFLLMLVFYNRLVPLKLKPKPGKPAAYKNGVFYSM
uniref:MFS domain-containing protein n=1 Tax=Caenorhabditis japonica TaxID=281687 RepID=A0A8R1HY09_CAEJA